MADTTDPIIRAAGILLVAPTGRLLLLRRTDAGSCWAFPGGKVEEGETAEVAARRETLEETGTTVSPTAPLTRLSRRVKGGVDFTTFLCPIDCEFEPALNEEHDLFRWATVEEALADPGLHPGCRVALLVAQGLDELAIARLIKIGELVSPQHYQNLTLIALRITGTGASYRSRAGAKKLDEAGNELKGPNGEPVYTGEYVWRDAKHYLTDEFLQRCQGLPVIWEHPPKMLDGEEFKERVVGTVMLPYILGSEVWGIAKIYDEAAAQLLETEQLSTSPGVRVSGDRTPTEDGRQMLVEDNPTLLDHVAICEVGVWDKGGPPAGVLNQSIGDATMADENKQEDRKDEAPKATLDDVMNHLTGLHGKMDSMKERQDRLDARMDSMSEDEKKDSDEDEKKDSDEDEKKDSDKDEEKKDSDKDEEKKDSDKDEDKKDSTQNDSEAPMTDRTTGDDLAKRVAALESAAAPLSPEAQREFTAIQAKADLAYQAFDSAAPRNLPGESPLAYRKRLLREHLPKSTTFKTVDLDHINDATALGAIEDKVYADAVEAARRPTTGGERRLIKRVTPNDAGIRVIEWFGDAGVAWDPFKTPPRFVRKFDKTPSFHAK